MGAPYRGVHKCKGWGDIGVDVVLGTTDTVLHFFYNAIAYAAMIPAFWLYIT